MHLLNQSKLFLRLVIVISDELILLQYLRTIRCLDKSKHYLTTKI